MQLLYNLAQNIHTFVNTSVNNSLKEKQRMPIKKYFEYGILKLITITQ